MCGCDGSQWRTECVLVCSGNTRVRVTAPVCSPGQPGTHHAGPQPVTLSHCHTVTQTSDNVLMSSQYYMEITWQQERGKFPVEICLVKINIICQRDKGRGERDTKEEIRR